LTDRRFFRSGFRISCCAACCAGLLACSNDLDEVTDFETLDRGPAQAIEGAVLAYSEEGRLTHRLTASEMERSADEEALWKVEGGFRLEVLDESGSLDAQLEARRGEFEEETRHLRAEGDVRLQGTGGDTLFTELLYWSADSDRVHTPARVRVSTPEGDLYGEGLESDARFDRYTILKPTGTFLVDTTSSP
jgi:LPS export ABC transporter protein LptC